MATTPAVSLTTEAVPVLDQHRFEETRLERYMLDHVDGFTASLTVEQVQGGMSNPTFILTDGAGKRYVMRKKPPGRCSGSQAMSLSISAKSSVLLASYCRDQRLSWRAM